MQIFGKYIKTKSILFQVLFWLAWIVCFTTIQSLGKGYDEMVVWIMYYLITLPIFIAHTFIVAYWLVPKFFFKREFSLFAASIIIFLIAFSIIELVVSNDLVFKIFDESKVFEPGYLNMKNVLVSGIGNHYIILVFLAIRSVRSWHGTKNQKDELALQKLETELEIFRHQLRPKFVYSLIEELENMALQKSEKTPEMIVKISDFLNSLFYEANAELIPIRTEIKLIKEFLSIQELVIGNRLKSNLVVNGEIAHSVIPPLLVFPFLNIAFREIYANNNEFETTLIIKLEKKYLLFSFTVWSEHEFKLRNDRNIGLTKKRLQYNYNGKHRIIENEDANFKEVSIEIFK